MVNPIALDTNYPLGMDGLALQSSSFQVSVGLRHQVQRWLSIAFWCRWGYPGKDNLREMKNQIVLEIQLG